MSIQKLFFTIGLIISLRVNAAEKNSFFMLKDIKPPDTLESLGAANLLLPLKEAQVLLHQAATVMAKNKNKKKLPKTAKSSVPTTNPKKALSPVHLPHGLYGCPYKNCDQKTKHRGNLIVHMRRHTGVKPYCCKVCGERFRHSSTLKKHNERKLKNHLK